LSLFSQNYTAPFARNLDIAKNICFAKKRSVNTPAERTKQPDHDHASTSTTYTFTANSHTNGINTSYLPVDCSATCHMVNDENMFVSYDNTLEPKKHATELADGYRSNEMAKAKGNAKLTLVDAHGNLCDVTFKRCTVGTKIPHQPLLSEISHRHKSKNYFQQGGDAQQCI
jgi:hypothetical protein